MQVRRRQIRNQLSALLREHLGRDVGVSPAFDEEHPPHPADLADVLWRDFDATEARRLFLDLPAATANEVLIECEEKLQEQLIEGLSPDHLAALMKDMAADEATDLLAMLPEERRQAVLHWLEPDQARDLRDLSSYDADTAGGVMTTEFLAVPPEEHVAEVLKRIKRDESESETIMNAFVVDAMGVLIGVVSVRDLLESNIHQPVGDAMETDVIRGYVDEDQEEVAHRMQRYNISTMPIVDRRDVLLGIVTYDDAMEVIEDEASEDAYLLAGATTFNPTQQPIARRILHRLPLMVFTVAAGFVVSQILALFTGSEASTPISTWTELVRFAPLVLGLSGNIGIQCSTIVVRGYATGEIGPGRQLVVLRGEVAVGALIGLICGALAGVFAALFEGNFYFGLIVGISVLASMTWTSAVATSIPMLTQRVGIDPALTAGPVMMALSDASACVLFFVVADGLRVALLA